MSDLTGRTIHGYEIRHQIGQGGQGVVYKAFQISANREVALKVLGAEYQTREDVQRFEQEARMIAQIEHPYIVPLYDYWHDEEGMYLVMRWLRGGSLRTHLTLKPFTLIRTEQMLHQIAGALKAAHLANIVHRDIKPDNILFDDYGNAHLTDFGIAKRLDNVKPITEPGVLLGSPSYLSPEQIVRKRVVPQTDIYSLGITLYQALTGHHPFGDTAGPVDLIMRHLQEAVPSVRLHNTSLPEALDGVIRKATDKEPTKRHIDVMTLLEEFRLAARSE